MTGHWVGYKLQATRNLATQVAKIARERGLPAGGWVGVGSRMAGFWIYPPGHPGGGGAKMLPGSYEAIARAFAGAEDEWFKFYQENVMAGDPRFAIIDATLGKEETTMRVKNIGDEVLAITEPMTGFTFWLPHFGHFTRLPWSCSSKLCFSLNFWPQASLASFTTLLA